MSVGFLSLLDDIRIHYFGNAPKLISLKAIWGGGVSDQILGLIVFGSKFYALSHASDGISKFCPVSPKMADTWGLVGCILGVRFRYLGTLRSTALKN